MVDAFLCWAAVGKTSHVMIAAAENAVATVLNLMTTLLRWVYMGRDGDYGIRWLLGLAKLPSYSTYPGDDRQRGAGFELQVFEGSDLIFGRRYEAREFAQAEAEGCRLDFVKDGWRP